jgi:hypothetical protein
VRHRGTIGGSVANNDPAADYPAAVLGLGATIITNKRKIAADDFFKGLFETALEPDEIITKVSFPVAEEGRLREVPHPASRYALVGVFVAKRGSDIRVAVTGAGSNGVFRGRSFEEALKKRFSPKSLEGMTHPGRRHEQRHPRQRRIPRPPRRRDGAPRGGEGVAARARERPASSTPACASDGVMPGLAPGIGVLGSSGPWAAGTSRDTTGYEEEPSGTQKTHPVPASIDDTLKLLRGGRYVADRSLATVLFLALKMGRPLFLEGEAGVGKTEIAKVLARRSAARLIRLQCYEGLDVASPSTSGTTPRR